MNVYTVYRVLGRGAAREQKPIPLASYRRARLRCEHSPAYQRVFEFSGETVSKVYPLIVSVWRPWECMLELSINRRIYRGNVVVDCSEFLTWVRFAIRSGNKLTKRVLRNGF